MVLSLVLAALYLWVGTRPRVHPALGLFPDWLGHATAYGVLAGTLQRGVGGFAFTVTSATGHGLLLEWLQKDIPGRSAEVSDGLADFLGALFGAWVFRRQC